MRQVSKKRAKVLRERKKLTDAMKREGPVMCQFTYWFPANETGTRSGQGCTSRADDLHEPGKRSQGADPSDPDAVIALCRQHHDWVHANPFQAAEFRLIDSRKREAWEAMGLSGRLK